MNKEKTVILLRGHPGSGKSTFTENVIKKNFLDVVVCSADHWFQEVNGGGQEYKFDPTKLGVAHGWCLDKFNRAIQEGRECIVVDNTNILRRDYQSYIEAAQNGGYKVFQAIMTGNFQNVHGVPEQAVERMKAKFQEDTSVPHYKT